MADMVGLAKPFFPSSPGCVFLLCPWRANKAEWKHLLCRLLSPLPWWVEMKRKNAKNNIAGMAGVVGQPKTFFLVFPSFSQGVSYTGLGERTKSKKSYLAFCYYLSTMSWDEKKKSKERSRYGRSGGPAKDFFPSLFQGVSCFALGEQTEQSKRRYLAGCYHPSMMSWDEKKKMQRIT